MEITDYIAERIRKLRQSYGSADGVSQEIVAKAIDVTPNTISRWETGTYQRTIHDLDKLARFFGVSILEFFPKNESHSEERVNALLRTAKQLNDADLEELKRYAEFRRARGLYPS